MMPKPPAPRTAPTGPTPALPKTMSERVGDIKGRMGSGTSLPPVINRPVSRPPTRPTMPLPGPVQTNFSPMSSPSPSPTMPAPMKKGGYVSNGGKINLGSGRVSTAATSKKSPNF